MDIISDACAELHDPSRSLKKRSLTHFENLFAQGEVLRQAYNEGVIPTDDAALVERLGDLGQHFPDTDPRYRDISSLKLLSSAGSGHRQGISGRASGHGPYRRRTAP